MGALRDYSDWSFLSLVLLSCGGAPLHAYAKVLTLALIYSTYTFELIYAMSTTTCKKLRAAASSDSDISPTQTFLCAEPLRVTRENTR